MAENDNKSQDQSHKSMKETDELLAGRASQERMAQLGRLMGGIAHELNNPISYVAGNFSILRDAVLGDGNMMSQPELRDMLGDIDDGLRLLGDIVTGMRKISRADKDIFSEVDLNDMIKTTLVAAHYEIKYAAAVEQELGSIPFVEANEGQLFLVLLSLILRAVHAIRSKGGKFFGTIRIRTSRDNEHVLCEIEDNGFGQTGEETGRIFEFSPEADSSSPTGGPDIGLVCNIVTNRHHGALLAESTPETGTKFTIKLPVRQGAAL